MARANIPCRMEVQMPATDDKPAGEVIILNPGWQDVPDEMANHPVIGKLVPKGPAGDRMNRIQAALEARNKAVAEAEAAYQKVVVDCQAEELKEYEEAGTSPDDQRAKALTGGYSQSTTAATMSSKVLDPPVGAGEPRARIEEGGEHPPPHQRGRQPARE